MVIPKRPPGKKIKKIKWSSRICKDKHKAIFSHNKFICLLNEFEHNDNLNSNTMVKKLFVIDNEVYNEISARASKNLQDSVFHYPAYIMKLSHEKHPFL
jgi:hypothetical protein